MKRRSVVKAYEPIRPDAAARDRMLKNILSSEISPAGKDDRMKPRKVWQLILVAALIAALAGTAGFAAELRKKPVKETAAFTSNDGTIEFYLDIDDEVLDEVIPSVEVVPHYFTPEDAKRVAAALFGDTQLYEEEPGGATVYSKQEIQRKLDRWSRYNSIEAQASLFPNKKDELDYLKRNLEVVEIYLNDYRKLYEDAPEENPHEPCRWTFRNMIEYMYPEDEWEENKSEDTNEEISAILQYNGYPYYFRASQRDHETFRVNNVSAGIGSDYSPVGMDDAIFKSELCRTSEPSQEKINEVKQKVENWLSEMELGNWKVDECYLETVGTGEYTEYYICVNAVPVFYGIPAIRREQVAALRGREDGKTYYYYTDAGFRFSPNGDLINFRMYSPVDIVSSNYENETLSIDELLEIAKVHLMSSNASDFSYIPEAYKGSCEVGCRITVRDVDYSLTRITDEDTREPFVYSLGASLSGSVEYYNKETGEILDFEENRILLVLDGKDGAFVGRG